MAQTLNYVRFLGIFEKFLIQNSRIFCKKSRKNGTKRQKWHKILNFGTRFGTNNVRFLGLFWSLKNELRDIKKSLKPRIYAVCGFFT